MLFIASFVLTIIGAFAKIMHWPVAQFLLVAGILIHLVFMFLALKEISDSGKATLSERIMWLIGFLFFGVFAGFIYLLSARKRIIRTRNL